MMLKPSYFIVRPDGYIALAGGAPCGADIERYFAASEVRLEPDTAA